MSIFSELLEESNVAELDLIVALHLATNGGILEKLRSRVRQSTEEGNRLSQLAVEFPEFISNIRGWLLAKHGKITILLDAMERCVEVDAPISMDTVEIPAIPTEQKASYLG